MGESRQRRLDELIDQVARGERELASIRDAELREAVRIALRLHREAGSVPDAYARMRMRARVLAGLEPRPASLRDHAWSALEMLARPAPYLVRAVAVGAVLVSGSLSVVAASADALPEEPLYAVKTATEDARLALASSPEDRAVVLFSIAAHRLREAERLAAKGRADDALVASAVYTRLVAEAAADLAPVTPVTLVAQLEARFASQRDRAQALASSLAASEVGVEAARVLATIAEPTPVPAPGAAQRVAGTAASVAEHLVRVAEAGAPAARSDRGASTRATAAPRRDADAPKATSRTTATPTRTAAVERERGGDKKDSVLRAVRRASEEARAAADRAKQRR